MCSYFLKTAFETLVKTRKKIHLAYCFSVLCTLLFASPTAHAEGSWVYAITSASGAKLYRHHTVGAELLGHYPTNMRIRVYSEEREGFHAVYFPQPWQGVHYAWIPKEEINLNEEAVAAFTNRPAGTIDEKTSSTSSDSNNAKVIGLGAQYSFINPTDWQNTLTDNLSTMSPIGLNAYFELYTSEWLFFLIHLEYFSFSKVMTAGANATYTYFLTAFVPQVGIGAKFYKLGNIDFSVNLMAGISDLMEVGNSNPNQRYATSKFPASFPLTATLNANYPLMSALSARLGLGYTLSGTQINVLNVDDSTSPTNVTLNELLIRLSLNYTL